MTYVAGLKAAELLCAERSKMALREARTSKVDTDKMVFTARAIEALGCAIAIREMIDLAMREEANGGRTTL